MFDFNRIIQTAINGIQKEDSYESDIAVSSSDDEEVPTPNDNTVSSSILAVKGTI